MNLMNVDFVTDIKDEELLQGLRFLCNTYAGTCPLNRDFGIDPDLVSENVDIIKALYPQEIMDKVSRFFNNVEVVEVIFDEEKETASELYPIIYLEGKEEENGVSI